MARKGYQMAKKAKGSVASSQVVENVSVSINLMLLQGIASGNVMRVTQDDALPLMQHNPPLIEVNEGDIVDGKAACRLTQEGFNMIAPHVGSVPVSAPVAAVASNYAIISNAALPAAKRGGRGGAPVQYPFDALEVGQSFFVPVSSKHANPTKTLGSTVSSANMRYSVETGEVVTKERTKRGDGNKAVVDAQGNKIREMVTVPVRKQTRKFSIRPVKAGVTYGGWTAESDGALIARVI